MASLSAAAGAVPLRRPVRIELATVACTLLLAVVGFCIIYPILLVGLQSFQISEPGLPSIWGLGGWRAAFSEPTLRGSLVNTLILTITRQAITIPLAVTIAWLLARTDLPGRGWI